MNTIRGIKVENEQHKKSLERLNNELNNNYTQVGPCTYKANIVYK